MRNRSSRLRTKFNACSARITYIARVGAVILISFLPVVAFAQSGAQGNGANRSAINSKIGSTLKNVGGGQRQDSADRKPLLPRGNQTKSDATRTPPVASGSPVTTAQSQKAANTQESCSLISGRKKGSCSIVEVSLEGSGDILQTNQTGQYERAGIEFVAGFKYEELFTEYALLGAVRSVRQYEQAGMKRKMGASVTRPLLDSSRKNVVSDFDGKKITIYSPVGAMKAEQYALLNEAPFNTTLLDRLLPNKEVKLGDVWQIPTEILAALLGVEAIENNTVRLTLTSIVDNFAEVELYLQGGKDAKGVDLPSTLECASEGASVALDLNGKYQYDMNSRQITWFGLKISERRSESVATPGLECNVTLKISVAPLDEPEKLTEDVVAKMQGAPKPEMLRLYYNAQKGPWKFQHSRRWKMIEDADKAAALCYVDRGEAVAQCNILSNGKIDLTTQPNLEGYKSEIQKGLGDRFAEFKQEAEYEGQNGESVYYVVADGVFEETPFRWVYYLITDKEGNQATIMFEIRADFLDRYDDSGNEIVESFRLLPRSTTGLQETIEKTAKADAQSDKKTEPVKITSAPSPKKK
ncbi:MAG: hypothetical protein IK077_10765 [Thermoguttaceae bacterium]|nr:hypothetical protein [Thermoguttaceae bacterium]